eukprot:Skav236260  [mRNA]  locus=scaffold829:532258:537691:- [translate_table: standard]
MAPKPKDDEDEETAMVCSREPRMNALLWHGNVHLPSSTHYFHGYDEGSIAEQGLGEAGHVIKYASFCGTFLAFASAILAIFAVSMEWWSGTESSQLLNVGLAGTETTLAASVSLWDFNLQLQLAPKEGSIDGEIHNLRTSWDDSCAEAELSSASVPYCAEVRLARACVILEAIFNSFFAAMIVLARRFSPLLLLAAVGSGVIAVLFAFAAAALGIDGERKGDGGHFGRERPEDPTGHRNPDQEKLVREGENPRRRAEPGDLTLLGIWWMDPRHIR